ncbi:hypothetical protein HZH68_003220 [Vespula germanica]|uniref:Uncharacterized protein n=1 Tax=Vespula germanica TaxID=30212 RepID=A0A834U2R5_VESGE|nr:hypothetical protein HZH68_003220 [Vespula germanica]
MGYGWRMGDGRVEVGGERWERRGSVESSRVESSRAWPGRVGLVWVGLGWVGLGELMGWVRKSGASELTISASKIRRAIDRYRCLFKG